MKHILFCTDGSHYSMQAAKYLSWLLQRSSADATALYVSDIRRFQMPALVDLSGSLGVQPYRDMLTQLKEVEKEKWGFLKDATIEAMGDQSLGERVRFEMRTGLLVDTIEDLENEHDLVIIGKRGEGSEFSSEHLGSTLERVIRVSEKPCLVTNRKYREIKRLAIAYDGGKSCLDAVAFLEGADYLKDLPIHVLAVAEGSHEDTAARYLEDGEKRLSAAGWKTRGEMLNGIAEDAISRYVETSEVDLLIMGAYGHSRIRRFLIGSTTTEMLRRCRIPVLCFH